MKFCFNQSRNVLNLNLVKFYISIIIISVNSQRPSQYKNTNKMFFDFDYLVSQLYVQHCTFVEIGEGVCSLFIELPINSDSSCSKLITRQMFFGNCLCSEFRSWQLCSPQLSTQRPDDCVFNEGTDCPSSSARVHRRLCDISGMSQWNPQCNCSIPLAGMPQDPLCGFRTCYANPMPASICTPRTVCGTARCDLSLHETLYAVKCDRRCKDHQDFCEMKGPTTSERRVVTSEWSPWQPMSCDDNNSVQQFEAECLDPEKKSAFDCIGPGIMCCEAEDLDCICEVKSENGHMKVYRYIIAFNTKPQDSSLKCENLRSARSVSLKGDAKVWNRFMDLSAKPDDSDSMFSQKKIKKVHNEPIKVDQIGMLVNRNHELNSDEIISNPMLGSRMSSNISIAKSSNTIENGVDVSQQPNKDVTSANGPLNTKENQDYLDDSALKPQRNGKSNLFGMFKLTKSSNSQNITSDSSGNSTANIHASSSNSITSNEDSGSDYHYSPPPSKESENQLSKGNINGQVSSKDNNSIVNVTNGDIQYLNKEKTEENYHVEDADINAIKIDENQAKHVEKTDKINYKESKTNNAQSSYQSKAKSSGDSLTSNMIKTYKNSGMDNSLKEYSGGNSPKERKSSLNEIQDMVRVNNNDKSSNISRSALQFSTMGKKCEVVTTSTKYSTECPSIKIENETSLLWTSNTTPRVFETTVAGGDVNKTSKEATTSNSITTMLKQSGFTKSSSKKPITTEETEEMCQTMYLEESSETPSNFKTSGASSDGNKTFIEVTTLSSIFTMLKQSGYTKCSSKHPITTTGTEEMCQTMYLDESSETLSNKSISTKSQTTKPQTTSYSSSKINSIPTEHPTTVTKSATKCENKTLPSTAMANGNLNSKQTDMPLMENKGISKPNDSLTDLKDLIEPISILNPTQALKDDDISKVNDSLYDEPEPVLKDLDKTDNADGLDVVVNDSEADALNNVIGKQTSDKLIWKVSKEGGNDIQLKKNPSGSLKNHENFNSHPKTVSRNKKRQIDKVYI